MGKMIKEQVDNGMDSKADFIMNDLKPLSYERLHHAWLKMKDKKLMMVKGWKNIKMIKAWEVDFQMATMEEIQQNHCLQSQLALRTL
jgi:hypothetical protein